MALADWFATIDLGNPTPAQQAVVDELGAMLDDYQPAHLDRQASSIQATAHHRELDNAITVQLVHASDPDATIELAMGTGQAIMSWLTAHEHLDADEATPVGRGWAGRMVDAVAAVLRGELEVEDVYRGRWLVKTRIIDVGRPGRAAGAEHDRFAARLPAPTWDQAGRTATGLLGWTARVGVGQTSPPLRLIEGVRDARCVRTLTGTRP